jgi:LacI family transcriptional regulator
MATIYEIAKLAEVSIGTVDRVIHKRGRVSRETEAKVNRIILELNYKPSVYARGLALSKTFCFMVLMPKPAQDRGYWHLAEIGIKKASQELHVYGIRIRHVYYDKYSHDSFLEATRVLLNQIDNLDALLIAPFLSKETELFLRQIPSAVPYVFFDSYIPNADNLSFIGQDSYQSGVLSAKLMGMLVRENGPVAVIKIIPEIYHLQDRVNGFQTFFKAGYPNPLKMYTANLEQTEEILQSLTKTILKENPDLKGIFVPSASASQVARFLHDDGGGHPKIHLIGYDVTPENQEYLENGTIDILISQRPETQGYRGIYSLYRHVVLKESIDNSITMPIDIVTKENVAYHQH